MSPIESPICITPHELIAGTNIPLSLAVRKLTSPSVDIIGSLTLTGSSSHIPRLIQRLNMPSRSCRLYSLFILFPTPISATSVGTPIWLRLYASVASSTVIDENIHTKSALSIFAYGRSLSTLSSLSLTCGISLTNILLE